MKYETEFEEIFQRISDAHERDTSKPLDEGVKEAMHGFYKSRGRDVLLDLDRALTTANSDQDSLPPLFLIDMSKPSHKWIMAALVIGLLVSGLLPWFCPESIAPKRTWHLCLFIPVFIATISSLLFFRGMQYSFDARCQWFWERKRYVAASVMFCCFLVAFVAEYAWPITREDS